MQLHLKAQSVVCQDLLIKFTSFCGVFCSDAQVRQGHCSSPASGDKCSLALLSFLEHPSGPQFSYQALLSSPIHQEPDLQSNSSPTPIFASSSL